MDVSPAVDATPSAPLEVPAAEETEQALKRPVGELSDRCSKRHKVDAVPGGVLKRVAEITLALSTTMREGRELADVEIELMREARRKLEELCQGLAPNDAVAREAARTVIEDLGLNGNFKDQRLGLRTPKSKIGESKKFSAHSGTYTSLPLQTSISGIIDSRVESTAVQMFASDKSSYSAISSTKHPPFPRSAISSPNQPFVDASTWSMQTQSVSLARSPPENMLADLTSAKVEGTGDITVSSAGPPIAKDQNFRTQTTLGNLSRMHQLLKSMNIVRSPLLANNHSEIAKIVQKLLQAKLPEHPIWTPSSMDYMNKVLTCQICELTVNEVDTVLLCDACEKGFHLKCLQPLVLRGVHDKVDWHCMKCLTLRDGKPLPPKHGCVMRSSNTPLKVPSNMSGIQPSSEKKGGVLDPSWSMQIQSASLARSAPENKLPDCTSAKVEGTGEVTVSRAGPPIAKYHSSRSFISQTTPGNLSRMFQLLKGLNIVQSHLLVNNHSEIAKIVQKLLQAKLPEHPIWTPPSKDYMNKVLTCQMCELTVNEVDTVLLCDACEKGFHLKCLQPLVLRGVHNKVDWHCMRCLTLSDGKPLPPKYGCVMRSSNTPLKFPSNTCGIQPSSEKKAGVLDPTWSVQIQSPSLARSAPVNKLPHHTSAKVEGTGEVTVSRAGPPIAKYQSFRSFIGPTTPGNLSSMHQLLKALNIVQSPLLANNHSEIAKIVQKLLQRKLPEHPIWTTPSRDYMNKVLTCQMCELTVHEVDTVLLCDACEKGFHLKCLQPSVLRGIHTRVDWHCMRCLTLTGGKPLPPKYGCVMRSSNTPLKVPSNTCGIQSSSQKKAGMLDPKVSQQMLTTNGSSVSIVATDNNNFEPQCHSKTSYTTEIQGTGLSSSIKHVDENPDSNVLMKSLSAASSPSVGLPLSSEISGQQVNSEALTYKDTPEPKSLPKLSESVIGKNLQSPQNLQIEQTMSQDNAEVSSCKFVDSNFMDHSPKESQGEANLTYDIKGDTDDQYVALADSGGSFGTNTGGRQNSALSSDSSHAVEWISDVIQFVDEKRFYQVDGVTYRLRDHTLFSSSHGKLIPSKLQARKSSSFLL